MQAGQCNGGALSLSLSLEEMGHLSCCMTMAVNYKRRNATLGIPRGGREGARRVRRTGRRLRGKDNEQTATQTPFESFDVF